MIIRVPEFPVNSKNSPYPLEELLRAALVYNMHGLLVTATWLLFTAVNAQLSETRRGKPALSSSTEDAAETHIMAAPGNESYWLADITHQGVAAFNPNPSRYRVFRNVKEYGARGMFMTVSYLIKLLLICVVH